jgi:hypothetical protein
VLVVDASVLVVALADDGVDGDAARARLRGEELAAPELLDLELTSVLRGQHSAGLIDDRAVSKLMRVFVAMALAGIALLACGMVMLTAHWPPAGYSFGWVVGGFGLWLIVVFAIVIRRRSRTLKAVRAREDSRERHSETGP